MTNWGGSWKGVWRLGLFPVDLLVIKWWWHVRDWSQPVRPGKLAGPHSPGSSHLPEEPWPVHPPLTMCLRQNWEVSHLLKCNFCCLYSSGVYLWFFCLFVFLNAASQFQSRFPYGYMRSLSVLLFYTWGTEVARVVRFSFLFPLSKQRWVPLYFNILLYKQNCSDPWALVQTVPRARQSKVALEEGASSRSLVFACFESQTLVEVMPEGSLSAHMGTLRN